MGDTANLYRFNSFQFSTSDCGEPTYYYSVYDLDGNFAPSYVYSMFESRIYDVEPKLQLGQYYANNQLLQTLEDQYYVETYVKIGEIYSNTLRMLYTFTDPCQNAVITIKDGFFEDLVYNLWSPTLTFDWYDEEGAVLDNLGYSFCSGIDFRLSKSGSDPANNYSYTTLDSTIFRESLNGFINNLYVYTEDLAAVDNSPYEIVVEVYLKLY